MCTCTVEEDTLGDNEYILLLYKYFGKYIHMYLYDVYQKQKNKYDTEDTYNIYIYCTSTYVGTWAYIHMIDLRRGNDD